MATPQLLNDPNWRKNQKSKSLFPEFFLWIYDDFIIIQCTRKTTVHLLMNDTTTVLAVYYALMQCSQAVCRFISCCWRRLPSYFNTTFNSLYKVYIEGWFWRFTDWQWKVYHMSRKPNAINFHCQSVNHQNHPSMTIYGKAELYHAINQGLICN